MTRTILVTGGAHGLGAAMVRNFRSTGDSVVIADSDAEAGAALAEATGAVFVPTDVRILADNRAAVAEAVARFGGLDVVCLNAGVGGGTTIGDDFDEERYRAAMAINLDGMVFGINAAIPALRARGAGAVLITSSIAGIAPAVDAYYSAAKHALIGLTRSFDLLLRRDRIRVNAICPGMIDTRVFDTVRATLLEHGVALADPADIAAAAAEIVAGAGSGEVWQVQAGRPAELVTFEPVTLSRSTAPEPSPRSTS